MCGRNVSLLSRVTPSVLTVSESGTSVPARSMLESKGCCHAGVTMNQTRLPQSGLSGFMAKPLKQNHAYMDERFSEDFHTPSLSLALPANPCSCLPGRAL